MKKTRKFFAMLVAAVMTVTMFCAPVMADEVDTYKCQLYSEVTDAGEVISKMVIDYGEGKEVADVDVDTFKVNAVLSSEEFRNQNPLYNVSGDYDKPRTIVKVEVDGSQVTVYFSEAEGATLSYLFSVDSEGVYNTVIGRNYPADLTYTVEQEKPITLKVIAADQRVVSTDENYLAKYTCDTSSIINEETAQFVSVEDKINYQLYKGSNDTLVVWFHGNGEGDIASSGNNVAQMLANRGTVAWATDEAQEIFGDAYVMSFQAPDSWYYAQTDNLLAIAHDEIQAVVEKYGINPNNILVSGCSAGGYMTTRMIIAYPDLFAAAMINCPALDVAGARGGETPTDEELASIKDAKTAIWLVQADADATVKTANCSVRLFAALTGVNVFEDEIDSLTSTTVKQDLDSDFTTYETKDGQYKLSLYDTTSDGYLEFAEDYDQDGVNTLVQYSNHWSWIYTLRNNPKAADGTQIWQWAASYLSTSDNPDVVNPTTPDTTQPGSTTQTPVNTGDASLIAIYGLLLTLSAGGYIAIKRKFN